MSIRILLFSILIFGNNLLAQDLVREQVDDLAASLVEQLNNYPEINTVAIAEFTDFEYTSNSLHRYLSDELAIALIMNPNRKFTVINRSRLSVLLAEAKLDADGLMDPTNLPRLGRLNGVEMVIGARVRATNDYLALTVTGIEVATSNALIAGRQNVTFIPSLKELVNGSTVTDSEADSTIESPKSNRPTRPLPLKVNQFNFVSEGCRFDGNTNQVLCNFEVTNEGATTNLSVYAQRTQVFFPNMGVGQQPTYIELADNDGRQRVSALVRNGETVTLSVAINSSVRHQQVSRLLLSCHAQNRGVFDVELQQLSVQ